MACTQRRTRLYLYILLEFQSGVDRWMALRMQVYVGLLYQDLVKRAELGPDAMLPPVLPIVFYNGAARWSASLGLAALILQAPGGMEALQASQQYCLVDQHALDPVRLATQRTVLSLLFRLELSELPDVVSEVLPLLVTWMQEDAQAPLRRDVALWVEQLVERESKGEVVIEGLIVGDGAMRGRKFETWADALEDRGLQRGVEQERDQSCAVLKRILQNLLTRRFQQVPPGTAALLDDASQEQLESWINQAMEADSVDALFAARAAPQPAPPGPQDLS